MKRRNFIIWGYLWDLSKTIQKGNLIKVSNYLIYLRWIQIWYIFKTLSRNLFRNLDATGCESKICNFYKDKFVVGSNEVVKGAYPWLSRILASLPSRKFGYLSIFWCHLLSLLDKGANYPLRAGLWHWNTPYAVDQPRLGWMLTPQYHLEDIN